MGFLVTFFQLVIAVILPLAGGFLGGYFFSPDNDWYKGLKKSDVTPPNWAFPIGWTIFYCCMGFASFLVYKSGGGFSGIAKVPLAIYAFQLILNWAWTPIFFGAHLILISLIDIIALGIAALICDVAFCRVNKGAGALMVPYLAWLGFASYLNFKIYQLN